MSTLRIISESDDEILLEAKEPKRKSALLGALWRAWDATADFFSTIKRELWPKHDKLSLKKIFSFLGKFLLMIVLVALLGVAAALSAVGIYLVMLLVCIALWTGAGWITAGVIKGLASVEQPDGRVMPLITRLHLKKTLQDTRLTIEDIRLFAAEIRTINILIEPSVSGPLGILLTIQTTSREISAYFRVSELDREEEAIEFGWKLGRLLGWRAYRARRNALLGMELTLLPRLTQPREDDPFRSVGGEVQESEIPQGAKSLELRTREAQRTFIEPEVKLAPFSLKEVSSKRYRISRWSPSAGVTFEAEPVRSPMRVLGALFVGVVLALVLVGVVYGLGAFLFLSGIGPMRDTPGDGSEPHILTLMYVTGAAGLLGVVARVPLLWKRLGQMSASFDWSRKELCLSQDDVITKLAFSDLQELVLREVNAQERQYRLILWAKGSSLLLFEGAAPVLAGRSSGSAPPMELSMLIELARALSIPWSCESLGE